MKVNVFPGGVLCGDAPNVSALQGGTIVRHGFTLQDADPDITDPRLTWPLQVRATNGIIHTIDRVLIPINI